MELARFAAQGEQNHPQERLYVGHPGCAARLDQPEWIGELKRPFTLAVAPLSEPHLRRFSRFLDGLAAAGSCPQLELSLNDWGALAYCRQLIGDKQLPWRLAAGLLLAEQHTDPLLSQFCRPTAQQTPVCSGGRPARLVWEPPPSPLVEHWRRPGVFDKIPLLRELGVSRVELCEQPLPWPEQGPGLPVSIYRRALLSVAPCCGACADCVPMAAVGERGGRKLYRAHNLIWYHLNSPLPPWADRLVEW